MDIGLLQDKDLCK